MVIFWFFVCMKWSVICPHIWLMFSWDLPVENLFPSNFKGVAPLASSIKFASGKSYISLDEACTLSLEVGCLRYVEISQESVYICFFLFIYPAWHLIGSFRLKTNISFHSGEFSSTSSLIIQTIIIWRLELLSWLPLLFFPSYFSIEFFLCSGHFPDYTSLFIQLFLIFKSSFSYLFLFYRDTFFFVFF